METLLENFEKANRNIIFVGTTAITHPDVWPKIKEIIFKKIDETNLHCKFIVESSNQLFQTSLRTDTSYSIGPRITFTQLKMRQNLIKKEISKSDKRTKQITFLLSSLPLPISIVCIDNELWFLPATGYFENIERFKKLNQGDVWYELLNNYYVSLTDSQKDARYLSLPQKELLELFDQDQIPRGIYPRDCFYNTDHYQFVIWDFVFSRKGEILIHKRSSNAKDNQDMWDKSVGGHVDFKKERSSSIAAVRELIEELFTVEKKEQTGHEFSLLTENLDKAYNLGEWRPEGRDSEYLNPVIQLETNTGIGEEPWVYYKIPGSSIARNTPRILPDGKGERKLRVLVDVFIFISNTQLTNQESLKQLQNSDYQFVDPSLLKTWIETGKDDHGDIFEATPDLNFIMDGKLRDVIEEVSQLIKYSEMRE